MITVTLKVLRESEAALADLASINLPKKLAFQVSRVVREVRREMETLAPLMQKALETYGKPAKQPGSYQIEPDRIHEFVNETTPLLEAEVSLNCEQISLDSLSDDVALKGGTLAALDWLISEEAATK